MRKPQAPLRHQRIERELLFQPLSKVVVSSLFVVPFWLVMHQSVPQPNQALSIVIWRTVLLKSFTPRGF